MRSIKKWRYFCDFCKKSGGSGSHMAKHEKGCTLNPARECGLCVKLNGGTANPLAELVAMLPDPANFVIHESAEDLGYDLGTIPAYDRPDDDGLREAVHAVLPALRKAAEDCPTCILAALRQRGIPVPVVTEFDYSKELASAWSEVNSNEAERESHYSYY